VKIANPIASFGEEKACEFLRKKGYKIIDRNFRKGYGEIDIVAVYKSVLVFIEVKSRTSKSFGDPLEAISYWKLKSLIKTAEYYKLIHKNLPDQMRIDAVSVMIMGKEVLKIEHHENISG
jgi:putative endonuclease